MTGHFLLLKLKLNGSQATLLLQLKVVLQLPLDNVAAYNELLLFTKTSKPSLLNFYCQTQKVMNTWNIFWLIMTSGNKDLSVGSSNKTTN